MITDQEIQSASRVRVRIGHYGDAQTETFHATVDKWTPSGRLRVKDDTGYYRVVSADNCKLIKQ